MKLIFPLLLIMSTSLFAGGPWIKKKNESYTQIGMTYKKYDSRLVGDYSNTRIAKLNKTITESQFWIYNEYGLGKKMELNITLPFSTITSIENNEAGDSIFGQTIPDNKLSAFANGTIALKYNIIDSKWLLTSKLEILTNLSSRKEDAGLQTGYNAWGITPTISIGKGSDNSFFSSDIGIRYLTNDYATSAILNLKYGYKVLSKTWLVGEINGLISFENGKFDDNNYTQTALYVDNQGYMALGGKISQGISENFSIDFSMYTGFIATINQGTNHSQLFLGLSHQF